MSEKSKQIWVSQSFIEWLESIRKLILAKRGHDESNPELTSEIVLQFKGKFIV